MATAAQPGYVLTSGTGGNGTWQPSGGGSGLTLPYDTTVSLTGTAFTVSNIGNGLNSNGIRGKSSDAAGVFGEGLDAGSIGVHARGLTAVGAKAGYFEGDVVMDDNLAVAGEVEVGAFQLETGALNGYVLTSDATGIGSWQAVSGGGGPDADWTIAGVDMYSAVAGNVGVGTTTPLAELDVNGTVQMQSFSLPVGAPQAGYVLTSDDNGVGTWAPSQPASGLNLPYYGLISYNGSAFHVDASLGHNPDGVALHGATQWGTGVRGECQKAAAVGIYGFSYHDDGFAGYFEGDVHVTGDLTGTSAALRIDHPLDPENKYLNHSFIESPDMMNVYNGNVVLDDDGGAWVELPDWFQAVNADFRYQLTCIGGFAPIYVAKEISDNQFRIEGGEAGMKVSWQVTGVRQDAYARAHRIEVEEDKPENDRGTYLHPEEHGMPRTMGARYEENERTSMGE